MKKVFISYRRDDNRAMAGRIYDTICARFGHQNVFFDVDTLPGGRDFHDEIASTLQMTGVMVVIIGSQWHRILLERAVQSEERDFVAIELKAAIDGPTPILPVLVGGLRSKEFSGYAKSASEHARHISNLQAIEVDDGRDYKNHVEQLLRHIEKELGFSRQRRLKRLATFLFIAAAGLLGFEMAEVRFRNRYRGIPEGALSVGLRGIEDRRDPGQAVPPEIIFRTAKNEVFISGISCYRTFDQHRAVVDELVASGKKVFVLIMDPDSPDIAQLSQRLKKPVDDEIRQVLEIIKNNRTLAAENMHVRLMPRIPPFTGVMIDGDVASVNPVADKESYLRVQPQVLHTVQHQGVILEFGRAATGRVNGFDFYAEDLRRQWSDAAGSESRVDTILKRP